MELRTQLAGWQKPTCQPPTPRKPAIFAEGWRVGKQNRCQPFSNPRFSAGLAVGGVGTPKGVASERQPKAHPPRKVVNYG